MCDDPSSIPIRLGLLLLLSAPGAACTAGPPSAQSCLADEPAPAVSAMERAPELIFQSGFEAGTEIVRHEPSFDRIVGDDTSVPERGDWEADLQEHPAIGSFRIFYSDGNDSQRRTTLVDDPAAPGDQVMEFRLMRANEPHVGPDKGRIQFGVNNNVDLQGFSYQVRIRLEDGFDELNQVEDRITWMTLAELWNNGANQAFPFRITLNLNKERGAGEPLYWAAHAQIRRSKGDWEDQWKITAPDVPLPIGEWATLRVDVAEGCGEHGWFRVVLTTEDGLDHTIVDRRDLTQHPNDPHPDGFGSFNPLKLYTGQALVDHVREQGANLVVLWDDFALFDRAGTP